MPKESLYLLTTWSFVHEEYSRGEKYIFALWPHGNWFSGNTKEGQMCTFVCWLNGHWFTRNTLEWENYGLFSLTLVNSFKKNILEGQRYGMSFDFVFIDSGETSQRQKYVLFFRLHGHWYSWYTLRGESIGISFGLMILQTPIKKILDL